MSGPGTDRVVVIGGGVTGLAAAHRLAELAAEHHRRLLIHLVEASPRLGGSIATEQRAGFLIEHGPDAFITTKPWALDLVRRLGIADQVISTNEADRRTLIAWRGRLVPVPEGVFLLAPTRFRPLLGSPLFSWRGKLRMALEWALPPGPNRADESLADFVTRRFGREALDRLAQPMAAGIYTADPRQLSLRATMPQFLAFEQAQGSVIRGLRRSRSGRTTERGARYSLFASFRDGMATLVEALQRRLIAAGADLRPGRAVQSIRRPGPAADPPATGPGDEPWRVELTDGTTLHAGAVIVTVPAFAAAALVHDLDPRLADELGQIPYASAATLNLAYARTDLPRPLGGFGFVVPAVEGRSLLACSFSSMKFPGRAPDGMVLLRGFIGGALFPELLERDDAAIERDVRADLAALLGIRAEPAFATLWRHPRSMPQYHVGHLDRVERIESSLKRHPGLALAGNAYRGVGIPDCLRSAEQAAESVAAWLRMHA